MLRTFLAVLLLSLSALAQTETQASNVPAPDGRGNFKFYTCSDPAANTELTCTVPAGKVWRVVSLRVSLVTDANAANRTVTFTADDGTTVFYSASSSSTQAASLTYSYNFADVGASASLSGTNAVIPTANRMILGPGYRLKSSTASIQATDNYGAPVVFVEEWNK